MDDVLLCASFMIGIARIRQWITKGKKSGSTSKENENKLGSEVSVDQLKKSQPGLVPQLPGKLTSAHIWDAQVMVEHFSDLTYVQLTRSIILEETLLKKPAFEA